jgi:hypothetical protein
MIVLYEARVESGSGERALIPALEEKPALVAEDPGLNEEHIG